MNKKNRKPIIYIAGPMRAIPGHNFKKFKEKSEELKDAGWEPLNPADMDLSELGQEKIPYTNVFLRKVLSRDMTEISKKADAIYMLSNWEISKGAKAERAFAKAIGIPVFYEIPLAESIDLFDEENPKILESVHPENLE